MPKVGEWEEHKRGVRRISEEIVQLSTPVSAFGGGGGCRISVILAKNLASLT